jgi:Spy/CpxP family protein refolding chaperone
MKTRFLFIALFFLAISSIQAQPGNKMGKDRNREDSRPRFEQNEPGDKFEHMAKMLELTDEQKSKIEALQTPHMKKMIAFRNQLGEKQAQKRTLMSADKPDQKKINALVDEVSKIRADQEKERINHGLTIKGFLTDDQKVKFDMMQQHNAKKGGKKGHNGPKG